MKYTEFLGYYSLFRGREYQKLIDEKNSDARPSYLVPIGSYIYKDLSVS